jgi:hypothetical protein
VARVDDRGALRFEPRGRSAPRSPPSVSVTRKLVTHGGGLIGRDAKPTNNLTPFLVIVVYHCCKFLRRRTRYIRASLTKALDDLWLAQDLDQFRRAFPRRRGRTCAIEDGRTPRGADAIP